MKQVGRICFGPERKEHLLMLMYHPNYDSFDHSEYGAEFLKKNPGLRKWSDYFA